MIFSCTVQFFAKSLTVTKNVLHLLNFCSLFFCFCSCTHTPTIDQSLENSLAQKKVRSEIMQKNSEMQTTDFIRGVGISGAPVARVSEQENAVRMKLQKNLTLKSPHLKVIRHFTAPEFRKQEIPAQDPQWQQAIKDTQEEILLKFEQEEIGYRINTFAKLDEYFSIVSATQLSHPQKDQSYQILMDYFQFFRQGKLKSALQSAKTLIEIFPHHPYFYRLAINAALSAGQKQWAKDLERSLPYPANAQTK